MKFALGIAIVGRRISGHGGASFLWLGHKVWPTWLITTYFLHSVGELCLSPVGLSSVTKLAPRRLVGQMMGIWFLATSLGNLIAGRIAGTFSADAVATFTGNYLQIVFITVASGAVLWLLSMPIKNLMPGVK